MPMVNIAFFHAPVFLFPSFLEERTGYFFPPFKEDGL